VITIARVRQDFTGYCIEKKEENRKSGVCIVVSLSWDERIEEVLLVFSMRRLRDCRVTIIALCIFENPNDTSFDAPPVDKPLESTGIPGAPAIWRGPLGAAAAASIVGRWYQASPRISGSATSTVQ